MSTEESKKPIISTKCPKCGQVVRFYSPGHEGVVKVKCSNEKCGHPFGVKITEKEIKLGGTSNQETASQDNTVHSVTDPITNWRHRSTVAEKAAFLQQRQVSCLEHGSQYGRNG